MSPLWVSYRSMTSRFSPFAFVELVSRYNKKNITRWLEDMNFMFSWQEQYLIRSLRSFLRYCSCHSNIKIISLRHRVISSIYNKKNITRWLENVNFMFSWQEHKIHIFSPPCNILYIYGLYRYMWPQRIRFFSCLAHKLSHFGLK